MLWMSEGEIVRSYHQADDKKEQVRVLSQLNAVTQKEILCVLENQGVDVDDIKSSIGRRRAHKGGWAKRPMEEYDAMYRPLYEQGLSDTAIARAAGTSSSPIKRWRDAYNLKPNSSPRGGRRRKEVEVI